MKKEHWLEYADEKYSKQQIFDIRSVLNVLYLFMPVPLFWALFDQQVSGRRCKYIIKNHEERLFTLPLNLILRRLFKNIINKFF